MKATTVKRVAILIAILSVLGGAGFITHEYQVKRLGDKELKAAQSALDSGDFANAEARYRNYLQNFPDNLEIQIAHADALLKVSNSLNAQNEAQQAYENVLKRSDGRLDVRRKLMQLKFGMGRFTSSVGRADGADVDLKILLEASSSDRSNP